MNGRQVLVAILEVILAELAGRYEKGLTCG
jgi:hypothetical protein